MTTRKKKVATLTYLDSTHPGTIFMQLPGNMMGTRLTIQEAADLSERLAEAVRRSGYDMVARRRS